jgi:hypothetical protein
MRTPEPAVTMSKSQIANYLAIIVTIASLSLVTFPFSGLKIGQTIEHYHVLVYLIVVAPAITMIYYKRHYRSGIRTDIIFRSLAAVSSLIYILYFITTVWI